MFATESNAFDEHGDIAETAAKVMVSYLPFEDKEKRFLRHPAALDFLVTHNLRRDRLADLRLNIEKHNRCRKEWLTITLAEPAFTLYRSRREFGF